jgi:hypothetical protein
MGAVAKSYRRKGYLIYEEMRKYLVIYEEAVTHISVRDLYISRIGVFLFCCSQYVD